MLNSFHFLYDNIQGSRGKEVKGMHCFAEVFRRQNIHLYGFGLFDRSVRPGQSS